MVAAAAAAGVAAGAVGEKEIASHSQTDHVKGSEGMLPGGAVVEALVWVLVGVVVEGVGGWMIVEVVGGKSLVPEEEERLPEVQAAGPEPSAAEAAVPVLWLQPMR